MPDPPPPPRAAPASQPAAPAPPPPPPLPFPPPAAAASPSAAWWEDIAKPRIISFLKSFSHTLAIGRRGRRSVAVRGLSKALASADWLAVARFKTAIASMDAESAAGVAVRTHLPLVDLEQPGDAHAAAEARFGPAAGLRAVRTAAGDVLRDPHLVEEEVASYFSALFNGRHAAAAGAAEPVDSGRAFVPDELHVQELLRGLPTLQPADAALLERPFQVHELAAAVDQAAAAKSPGLDGLSYEFYRCTLPLLGPALLDAFNAMLADGRLTPSLRRGVVRLLPKVAGVPAAHQLRPITLLCTDYKLLTKMIVNRLLPLLPSVITSNQLCSVQGRSIFEGPAMAVSAAAFLALRERPGFLLSLDFFHAYDRVSMAWVDRVLAAMGFGCTFRAWVAALHRDASACFLLHTVSHPLDVTFSVRQGDPLAALLFVIYIEPFLRILERQLHGLFIAGGRDTGFGYMDDVEVLSGDLKDLLTADSLCRRFEAASGAILNRNRKTVILGLGTWAGRTQWPLPWLQATSPVKVLGFMLAADLPTTIAATWERATANVRKTLALFRARRLPTLLQRSQAIVVFVLSRLWYFCQVLPLPPEAAAVLRRAAADFLWRGYLERLPWDELHSPFSAGGLALPCIQTRAEALFTKQWASFVVAGDRLAAHATFWLGQPLRDLWPTLPAFNFPQPRPTPTLFTDLLPLLQETAADPAIGLRRSTSRLLYQSWTSDLPPPKIEYRLGHLPWRRVWRRLEASSANPIAQNTHFLLLHNILPTPARRFRLGLDPSAVCLFCDAPVADVHHLFVACARVVAAWSRLFYRASLVLPFPLDDELLLYLAWPPGCGDDDILVEAVTAYTDWVWTAGDAQRLLDPGSLQQVVLEAVEAPVGAARRSIFG